VLLAGARGPVLNRRGAAMLLALVVTMALLPAAAAMAAMARADLAAALDDYHRFKAQCAARGALALAAADLRRGGDGQVAWPDPDVTLEISIAETGAGWQITVAARCGRATGSCSGEVPREPAAGMRERAPQPSGGT